MPQSMLVKLKVSDRHADKLLHSSTGDATRTQLVRNSILPPQRAAQHAAKPTAHEPRAAAWQRVRLWRSVSVDARSHVSRLLVY